jgi:hypothetical protein
MLNKENYILAALVLTFGVFTTSVVAQDESADDVEEVLLLVLVLKQMALKPLAQLLLSLWKK